MNDNTDEIDLIELLKKIYLEKKLILKISVLAALIWCCLCFISAK
jgi:LPS O-antigen subunit length determinant protein (WzzB/FepE family)